MSRDDPSAHTGHTFNSQMWKTGLTLVFIFTNLVLSCPTQRPKMDVRMIDSVIEYAQCMRFVAAYTIIDL
jgi:hypothetical protein